MLLPALEEEAELTVIGRWITRRFLLAVPRGARPAARLRRRRPRGARRGDRPARGSSPARPAPARRSSTRCSRRTRPAGCPKAGSCCARCRRPIRSRAFADPTPASRSPTASCACPARSRASSTPSTCTAAACTRSACRRCRSRSGRRSSPRATTCRRTSTGTSACDLRRRTTCTGSCCRCCSAASRNMHWVLKSPVHLHALPTLLAVYPDARLVVTHRDPLTVLASLTSLVATLALGTQRPTSTSPTSAATTTTSTTARSTASSTSPTTARSTPRACTTCTTPTSCDDQFGVSAVYGRARDPLDADDQRGDARATSPAVRRTSTVRTTTRSPTSASTPPRRARALHALPAALLVPEEV